MWCNRGSKGRGNRRNYAKQSNQLVVATDPRCEVSQRPYGTHRRREKLRGNGYWSGKDAR